MKPADTASITLVEIPVSLQVSKNVLVLMLGGELLGPDLGAISISQG